MDLNTATYTAFLGETRLVSGTLREVLPVLKARFDDGLQDHHLVVIENHTGKTVDFLLTGSLTEVLQRVEPHPVRTGPGRPKLGVTSREISLLPVQWEWLEQQPNGASAALRRLVDEARKRNPGKQRARQSADATSRFLTAMAGNLPGYEEATRALYNCNRRGFEAQIQGWPADIREHALTMSQDAFFLE